MPRDPALETVFRDDLGRPAGLTSHPMFGGLCFLLDGNMIGAARAGRSAEAAALALPGTEPMTHGGAPRPGYVWLSGPALADPDVRRRLAGMAMEFTRTLPPKKE